MGPIEIFEGPYGLFESVTGPFNINWENRSLEKMLGVSVKKYIAGVHSQTAIEGVSELQAENTIEPNEIEAIEVETYERAYFIMGGGGAGDKHDVRTRETTDHSLPYVLSAVLLDGQVMPPQYEMARILADDVQRLLHRVTISSKPDLTARYPAESPVRIKITMKDGTACTLDKSSYEGFPVSPMTWEGVRAKFAVLTEPHTSAKLRDKIIDAVSRMENISIRQLGALLGKVQETS